MYFGNYIKKPIGNNKLSYNERKKLGSNCQLFVPNILEIKKEQLFDYLKLGKEIVFEEILNGKLYSQIGLENYLSFKIGNSQIYIFDNHNLAFYFIGKYYLENGKKLDLIHIDQHSDMYEPYFYLDKLKNLEQIEKYTFEGVNVGSYILPLQKLEFIGKVYQKRTQIGVLELEDRLVKDNILNIDLDFWEENMATDEKSLYKVKKYIGYSPLILIATSPYFINQEKALKLIKKLFT